jgi:(p)ppGpp synthase/HD superfamily hydrolase
MKLTPKIQKAIIMSSVLHKDQVRKGDDFPFVVHPFSVAAILSEYTDDVDIISAGLLHDVIEDVDGYEYADLERDFGKRTADIVMEVSEDMELKGTCEKATWKERKEKYLQNLENDCQAALMVSCADKIHNLQSLMAAYAEQGENLWEKFHSTKQESLWFYAGVLHILKSRLKNPILEKLETTFAEAKNIFGK